MMDKVDNIAKIYYCPPRCDCEAIENRLTALEQEVTSIKYRLTFIESFIYLSDVIEVWSTNTSLMGAGVGIIHAGHTYNFWGIGELDHQQTLQNGVKYYLILASQYEDLLLYQGDTTIGTLWIETPDKKSVYSIPIRFDATGIYFTPHAQITNLPEGTTLKFTQALILVEEK